MANPFRVKTHFDVMVPKVLASSNLGLKLANAFGVNSKPKSANAFGVNSKPKSANAFGVNSRRKSVNAFGDNLKRKSVNAFGVNSNCITARNSK